MTRWQALRFAILGPNVRVTARVSTHGAHELVTVWIAGKYVGVLTVGVGEGSGLAAHLSGGLNDSTCDLSRAAPKPRWFRS